MKKIFIAGMAAVAMSCQTTKEEAFCFDEMTYSPSETVFKLFAPRKAICQVVVGQDTVAMKPTDLPANMGQENDEGAIWTATVKGDLKGCEYAFIVDGQISPGVFAKAVTVNGQKGVVVDMADTNPEGWDNDSLQHPQRLADWTVYEMHHRDFSINRADAVHPGKFLALTESWAISHLQRLGISAVHLLPSYDFGSIDESRPDIPQYNWGYDPLNYNVPEGSYSTNAAAPLCRIREFKQMVQSLHRAGIGVILDVVYNHTYDMEHSNFQRTFPGYYYRGLSDGSGCGNETASEQPMMRRFMIESVKYWVKEYHIDGFRFDLMGCHDIETMNQIRQAVDQIDPTILIYGEGWSAGQCALPTEQLGVKANVPLMPRIAAFSDDMRDALRGPFSNDSQRGWLGRDAQPLAEVTPKNEATETESLKAGLAGMVEHPQVDYTKVNYSDKPYALEPTQMMAYVSCHDDMCLTDRLRASIPGIQTEELIRLDLLAQTAVFCSQGIPFMLSGEELLRTKQGVHNSFESPDSINQLDWVAAESHPEVLEYYSRLITLRSHHPAFRMGTAQQVREHLEFLPSEEHVVAFRLKDHAGGDECQDIIVVLNANRHPAAVEVPEGQYTVLCQEGCINEDGLDQFSGHTAIVAPQSALILCR